MALDKILVTIFSLVGIAFTYWFFLMKKEEEAVSVSGNKVAILVKGGYDPSVISIPKGEKTTISFIRKDPSSCLEEVVLSDFKIRKYLPIDEKVTITVTPQKEGIYNFECGMGMFHGKIIVE